MTTIHRIACPIPFPLKAVNCYYINDACPTLIDTGVNTPDSLDCVEAVLRQNGGALRDIRRVIITHSHTDHAGLAGRLANTFGAEVFIHQYDFPKFISADAQQTELYFQRFKKFLFSCGVPDDLGQTLTDGFTARVRKLVAPLEGPRLLSGGETFAFDDFELHVVPTPGHSAGSISLFDKAGGLLFSGDALLEKITPNPVVDFGLPDQQNGYRSLVDFSQSLRWMHGQDVTKVLPGHGAAFDQARQRTTAILDHFERRRKKVLKMMAPDSAGRSPDDDATVLDLARRMFPGLKEAATFLGLSEAYGYLQWLASESLVDIWREQGIYRYRLKNGL